MQLGRAGRSSRIAGEDDTEELFAIELFAGEDAELAEDGGEGFLGFVDDEHGPAATGADVIEPIAFGCLEAGPPVMGREGHGEQVAELAIEVHGATLRMLDGADQNIRQGAEALGEHAEGDAAGAGIAGDHGESAVGDSRLDAADEAVDGGGGEERVGRHVGPEGMKLETVERKEFGHESSVGSSSGSCFGK